MFEGRLEISDGPIWRQDGTEIAAAINVGDSAASANLIIETGAETWTIQRTRSKKATRDPISELAGNRYELFKESVVPVVWTEDLGVGAMRRALTDHVGVGLGWSDRWRLANATARAIPLMVDVVTAGHRYELRPRFEAVAYPVYPSLSESTTSSAASGCLLFEGNAVAEGNADFFRAWRPLPLEVVLLTSLFILTKSSVTD